jgi:tetratricopeptide (TPR) repeat protein
MQQEFPMAGEAPQEIVDQLVGLHEVGALDIVFGETGRLLQAFPASYVLWQIYGGVLLDLGHFPQAEMALGQAAQLRPDLAEALANHATALRAVEKIDEAEAVARRAVALEPESQRALAELAAVLLFRGDMAEVVELCEAILRMDKTSAPVWNTLGVALQARGEKKAAVAAFRKALRLAPRFAEAHRNLSAAKSWVEEDAQFRQMMALYKDETYPAPERMRICMGLFNACDKLDKPKKAWRFLSEANGLRKAQLGYDIAVDRRYFARLREVFGRLEPLDVVPSEVVPVFILGMPRSGTSLVEQIVSAHDRVTGAGELSLVTHLAQGMMSGEVAVDEAALRAFREAYLAAIVERAEGRPFVTDKMPHNFRFAGLIAAALPEARIVHVMRDARAVCWSNLRHFFVAQGLGYACDPEDVVGYHGLYRGMMAFWEARWPGRIRRLDYEALVADPEAETKALIADLGLEWDAACLYPERNRRAVRTASTAQIRKRVYGGSSKAWRRYKPYLDAPFAALDGRARTQEDS